MNPALHKPFSRRLTAFMFAVWLCLVVLGVALASASAPETPKAGAEAPQSGAEGVEENADAGHGAPAAAEVAPPKVYKLAEPLGNKFDLSTLRVSRKTGELRYNMDMISSSVPASGDRNMRVSMNIVLEFGSETGMAEAEERKEEINDMARRLVARFSVEELETTEGKMQLKEMIALNLNRRFKTAQVRKVYYMMFHISPNR